MGAPQLPRIPAQALSAPSWYALLTLGCLAAGVFAGASRPAVAQGRSQQQAAAPARSGIPVILRLTTPVPEAYRPLKPGSTTERLPLPLELSAPIGPLPPVTALAFTPDGRRLLVGTDGRVSLRDVETGALLGHLAGVGAALPKVHDIELSPDGKRLAVAGGDPSRGGTVLIYAVDAIGAPVVRLTGHTDVVHRAAWSPDASRIVTASPDKTARVWDSDTGKELFVLRDHTDFVLGAVFAGGGELIATGGRDRVVRLTELRSGKGVRSISGAEQPVHAVAVAPDGRTLVAGTDEPAIRWWNTETGQQLRTSGGHGGPVLDLRFAAEGKRLLSAGADRTVRLWDAANGAAVQSFNGEDSPQLAAALSPDGRLVAGGGADGRVRLWKAGDGRLLAVLLESPAAPPKSEWLAVTGEGWVDGSATLLARLSWQIGGAALDAGATAREVLAQPERLRAVLRGEPVQPPELRAPGAETR